MNLRETQDYERIKKLEIDLFSLKCFASILCLIMIIAYLFDFLKIIPLDSNSGAFLALTYAIMFVFISFWGETYE